MAACRRYSVVELLCSLFILALTIIQASSTITCNELVDVAHGKNAEVTEGEPEVTTTLITVGIFHQDFSYGFAETALSPCETSSPGVPFSWEVNLEEAYVIKAVYFITSSAVVTDDEVVATFTVDVGRMCCEADGLSQDVCYQPATPITWVTEPVAMFHSAYKIYVENVTGTFVRVTLNTSETDAFAFCGMKVNGCPLESLTVNRAKDGDASQSSTYEDAFASLAVDGDLATALVNNDSQVYQCAHTQSAYGNWWEVDIGQLVAVSKLVIYNRDDCCGELLRNIVIELGRHNNLGQVERGVCYAQTSSFDTVTEVVCDRPMCGQFVRIGKVPINNDPLALCEVQLFGYLATVEGNELNTPSSLAGSSALTTEPTVPSTEPPVPTTEPPLVSPDNPVSPAESSVSTAELSLLTTKSSLSTTESLQPTTESSMLTVEYSLPTDTPVPTAEPSISSAEPSLSTTEPSPSTLSSTSSATADSQGTSTDSLGSTISTDFPDTATRSGNSGQTGSPRRPRSRPGSCRCSCVRKNLKVTPEQEERLKMETEEMAEKLETELRVDTKTIGRVVRKKISAGDGRRSAKRFGLAAVTALSLVGAFIVVPDLFSLLLFWLRFLKRLFCRCLS